MRCNIFLMALAASSVATALQTESSPALKSTELIVRGLDGEAHVLARGKWNGKTAEAIYKVCTVAGASTYAICRIKAGGGSSGAGIPCNAAVGVALAGAAMEAAVKCHAALQDWKKAAPVGTPADLEAASHLLQDPRHPPIDTLGLAANTPLPPSPGGSRSNSPSRGSGRGKRDTENVIAKRHPRQFEA